MFCWRYLWSSEPLAVAKPMEMKCWGSHYVCEDSQKQSVERTSRHHFHLKIHLGPVTREHHFHYTETISDFKKKTISDEISRDRSPLGNGKTPPQTSPHVPPWPDRTVHNAAQCTKCWTIQDTDSSATVSCATGRRHTTLQYSHL